MVKIEHSQQNTEVIKKFDYKISLQRCYSYTAKEKRQIMCTYKCKDLIYKVLEVEAPIHIDECFERITKYLCMKSAKQYYSNYKYFITQEIESGKIIEKNKFLYLEDTRIIVRNRNTPHYEVYCGKININYIPPDEIIKVAKTIIKHNFSIHEEELARFVSQEIGFGRMTQKISDVIYSIFEQLKNDDEVRYKLGRYSHVPTIQINDIVKIAKGIIKHYENIREEDLVKLIMQEIGSKATKSTKSVLLEGLEQLKKCSDIKYKFGSYEIQKTLSPYTQKTNNQENTERFEGFINKILDFFSKL